MHISQNLSMAPKTIVSIFIKYFSHIHKWKVKLKAAKKTIHYFNVTIETIEGFVHKNLLVFLKKFIHFIICLYFLLFTSLLLFLKLKEKNVFKGYTKYKERNFFERNRNFSLETSSFQYVLVLFVKHFSFFHM